MNVRGGRKDAVTLVEIMISIAVIGIMAHAVLLFQPDVAATGIVRANRRFHLMHARLAVTNNSNTDSRSTSDNPIISNTAAIRRSTRCRHRSSHVANTATR
jgi:prepilin-type N-terminal cleavage/methylation domain-containing protein